jgi:transglutaminase-like putative cysteine protease
MKHLRIDHTTEYAFDTAVSLLPHRILVRPRGGHNLRIASSTLEISPAATVHWQRDALDNSVAVAAFSPSLVMSLRIVSSVVIEQYEGTPLDFTVEQYAVTYPFEYQAREARVLAPFRVATWPSDTVAVEQWLARLGLRNGPIETFVLLDRLNRALHGTFRYQAREEAGVQSPSRTLALGTGSCRDFAALFNESCRALGLASRFVSGYLHAPGLLPQHGATHAWCEAYLPGAGWKGFDPTSGELTGSNHIPVAVAHHPEDVPPIAGAFVGSQQKPLMRVTVHVRSAD